MEIGHFASLTGRISSKIRIRSRLQCRFSPEDAEDSTRQETLEDIKHAPKALPGPPQIPRSGMHSEFIALSMELCTKEILAKPGGQPGFLVPNQHVWAQRALPFMDLADSVGQALRSADPLCCSAC